MDDDKVLEKRKQKLKAFITEKNIWSYAILAFLMVFGYIIRTRNLKYLLDITTGKFIPLALDPFVFMRYAREVLANGSLAAVDTMRYVPWGYNQVGEFNVLSHVVVYLYKFLHLFNPNVTLEYAHVVYPPVFFSLSLIFFFLLVRRLFNDKVGLLATAFLVVLPSYLYRSLAGFSDKESLAMFFMFAAMYFYVRAWQEKSYGKSLIIALISGIITGLMGLTWGGVSILFLIFGVFTLVEVVLNKLSEREFYVYAIWLFSMILILKIFFGQRYTISNLALSVTSGFMFLAFLVGLINLLINKYNLFNLKDKLKNKLPVGIFSLIVSIIVGLISVTIIGGFGAIIGKAKSFIINLLEPFGSTRWALTVAESHQPYVADWIGQWGWMYMLLMLIGSTFLIYNLLKDTKLKWGGTVFYVFFILSFIFSRYRAGTKLDGVNGLSKTLYIGSLALLFIVCAWVYFYAYKKDKGLYDSILNFDRTILFVLIWFLVMVVAARSAVRLIHIFSPITVVLVSYAFVKIYEFAKGLDQKYYKFAIYFVLVLFLVLPNVHGSLINLYNISNNQASNTGPSYNQQWQVAMSWVRENTNEDAVFAHWWDYGYWVQTGGERATITDGGNAGAYALNHFMGRHVLTGQTETEALEFLYAKNATHLLMINDEIGKYPAFSSIGSDVDYDRYSYISTFQLDNQKIQERRNDTLLFYIGSYMLDEDFIFGDNVLPSGSAGIGGFLLPVVIGGEDFTFKQPEAIIVYAGQQFKVPLECVFINGKEIKFENKGLGGCLVLIPRLNGQQYEPFGAALYLSARVSRTLFTRLFIYGGESGNFKTVYDDSNSIPLGLYNGRLLGPLKIWELNYPKGLKPNEWYYGKELPNPDVMNI